MKAQHAAAVVRKHSIEHERVDVYIEVERAAEALNDGHRAAPPIRHAVTACATSQESTSTVPR